MLKREKNTIIKRDGIGEKFVMKKIEIGEKWFVNGKLKIENGKLENGCCHSEERPSDEESHCIPMKNHCHSERSDTAVHDSFK